MKEQKGNKKENISEIMRSIFEKIRKNINCKSR